MATRLYVDEKVADEATTRGAADTALDARLDTVEEWRTYVDATLTQSAVFINEDFTGDQVNRGIWTSAGSGVTIVAGAGVTGGAIGIAQIDPQTAGGSCGLTTTDFEAGTFDFRMAFRVKMPNYATAANATLACGLLNTGSANNSAYFILKRTAGGTSNILAAYDAQPAGVDTGVAISAASWYRLEIRRTGSLLEFLVNGTVLHSYSSYTRDITDTFFTVVSTLNTAAALVYCDYAKLRLDRDVATTPGATAPDATHVESGWEAITTGSGDTHEYLDVMFDAPFGAATGASGYTMDVQLSLTADTGQVTWVIVNKTINGCRIKFSESFNGECRWSAS
jgi:hypothetical protein